MAIFLTALSANATIVETSGSLETISTAQNQVDAISLGKAAPYLIESSQLELIGENEQESLPLLLDDSSFFIISNCNNSNFFRVVRHCTKIAIDATSFSKYYTKQLLFPFHSYW